MPSLLSEGKLVSICGSRKKESYFVLLISPPASGSEGDVCVMLVVTLVHILLRSGA